MSEEYPSNSQSFHPFADLIGLEFSICEEGYSECHLTIEEKILNPYKSVHGGIMYSMADTGMGGALHSSLAVDERGVTAEIKINYFKPVYSGELICKTKVIHKGKRLAALESEVRNKDELVAKALGTFSIYSLSTV